MLVKKERGKCIIWMDIYRVGSLGREGFSSAMTGLKGTSVSVNHPVLLAGSWHTGKENPSLSLGFSTTLLSGHQMSMTFPHLLPTHLSQMAG